MRKCDRWQNGQCSIVFSGQCVVLALGVSVMRRLRRAHVGSFGHGLMLAALPVLAFLTVDYMVAPPTEQGAGQDASRSKISADERANASESGRSSGLAASIGETVQKKTGQLTTGSVPAARSPNLASSIQSELRRVGCYAGEIDGTWNDGTRAAMRAFNTSVHVNLVTDKPDYILLTLLQGHSSKACSRGCDSSASTGRACIDKSIEARAVPPATLATRQSQEQTRGEALTSSVSIPILLSKPVPAVRPANPSPSATVPANRWVTEVDSAPPVVAVSPLITGSTNRNADAVSEARPSPLPGRMAVGVLPIPEPRSGSGSETAISETRPVERPRAVSPVVSRSARPERRAPDRGSRLSRTFSDLTRVSP